MGNLYWVTRTNVTPTAGNDLITIVSGANRRCRIRRVNVVGRGATSAAQGLQIARSSGGVTGGGAITPTKGSHAEQPAATFVANTTWGTQPTLDTNPEVMGWNAIGGSAINNLFPGTMEARNGETLSLRSAAGFTPQAQDIAVLVEED